MTSRTFEQDFNGLGGGFAAMGAFMSGRVKGMTPFGRRIAVTSVGAVLALGLGVATASAFRLPPEITDPAQPQDQVLAQSELPAEAAARSYALQNPPAYPMAAAPVDAAAPSPDTSAVLAMPQDDTEPAPTISTSNGSDQPATNIKTADSRGDAADTQ